MKTKKPRFAAKILALVLSLLMLLGAMPVAFAAEGDIVVKWPTAIREIEYGQYDYEAGLNNDGEASIPGKFEFHPTGKPTGIDAQLRPVFFVPEDTSMEPIQGATQVTVLQSKSAKLEGGLPVASSIQAGQKLSDSTIDKLDIKLMNYGESIKWKCSWKEPDKVMDAAGTYTEILECYPSTSANKKKIASIDVEIEIVVEGGADTIAVIERPTASQIEVGQTLADSTLTGGVVTKGGNPVAGKFAWKDSSIAPTAGTRDYTVVFTPDDSSVCEPQEMQVSVTTVRPELEIAWADEIEVVYLYNSYVEIAADHDREYLSTVCKANIPGTFRVPTENAQRMTSIDQQFTVKVCFSPDDTVNYEKVYKDIPVKLLPDNPDCIVYCGMKTGTIEEQKTAYWTGYIQNEYNMEQATGKLYLVLDGEKTEVALPGGGFTSSELTPGEHTVYSEYIPGENDVYEYDKSNEETFVVPAFNNVTVVNGNGTAVKEYKAGATVTVTAQPHEKSYYDFTGWTAEGITLTEEEAAQQKISFTMPENEVKLTANYKFNFKNFVKYVFEQIGIKLMALVTAGIQWIKDAIQNIPRV